MDIEPPEDGDYEKHASNALSIIRDPKPDESSRFLSMIESPHQDATYDNNLIDRVQPNITENKSALDKTKENGSEPSI
jgi:hypothetical protein